MIRPANEHGFCLLAQVPDELLLCIMSHLEVVRGFLPEPEAEARRQKDNVLIMKTLYSLTLTCRRLAAITTPYLYTCFIQTWTHLGATKLLQRTLCRRPDLAKHIRYLENLTTRPSRAEIPMYYDEAEWEIMAQWLAAANWKLPDMLTPFRRNSPFQWKEWSYSDNEGLQKVAWDELNFARIQDPLIFATIVIISLADNLAEVAAHRNMSLLSALAFRHFSLDAGLQTLWLIGQGFQDDAITTIKAYPTGLRHPLQDYIRTTVPSPSLHEEIRRHQPFFQSSFASGVELSELSLEIYDITSSDICRYLGHCKALKRASIRWISHSTTKIPYAPIDNPMLSDRGPPREELDLPAIGRALSRFATTLQSLRVDTLESGWLVDMETDIPAIGNFRELTKLTYLEVSGLALWGDYSSPEYRDERLSSLLPPSIEILCIRTEWDDDVEHALLTLILECTTTLPNLRQVECSWRPAPKAIAKYLVMAFQDKGVKLIVDDADG
jgi:hypothetical protein